MATEVWRPKLKSLDWKKPDSPLDLLQNRRVYPAVYRCPRRVLVGFHLAFKSRQNHLKHCRHPGSTGDALPSSGHWP